MIQKMLVGDLKKRKSSVQFCVPLQLVSLNFLIFSVTQNCLEVILIT